MESWKDCVARVYAKNKSETYRLKHALKDASKEYKLMKMGKMKPEPYMKQSKKFRKSAHARKSAKTYRRSAKTYRKSKKNYRK